MITRLYLRPSLRAGSTIWVSRASAMRVAKLRITSEKPHSFAGSPWQLRRQDSRAIPQTSEPARRLFKPSLVVLLGCVHLQTSFISFSPSPYMLQSS